MYFIYKKEKGFTLIELIISVFILSIAIVGIFSAFLIMVILTSDVADRFTATYLAQEGIEIVRNVRDTNWLNMDQCLLSTTPAGISCPASWVDGLTTVLNGASNNAVDCSCDSATDDCSSKGCTADYTTGTGVSGEYVMAPWAGSPTANYLYIDDTNGFYSQKPSATQTKFKRKILITPVTDSNGDPLHIIKVEVQVSWDQRANILNSATTAGTCAPSNCIKAETTLYDWYNYIPQ